MRYPHAIVRLFLVAAVIVLGTQAAHAYLEKGRLSGPSAKYTFAVNAGTEQMVEVKFTYPIGSVDFWVKVIGKDGTTVLGDVDLDEGRFVQLSGGGTFYLTIYSKKGAGEWRAIWYNRERCEKCSEFYSFEYSKENFEKALACYTAAIALDPNDVYAYNLRGNLYLSELRMYDQAIADYTRAIEIDPSFWGIYGIRANAYEKIEEYEKAIADYTRELSNGDPQGDDEISHVWGAYRDRGKLYEKLGRKADAIKDYRHACEIEGREGYEVRDGCEAYERMQGK
jgi:tetratricopeptide (TPR) repeat protein